MWQRAENRKITWPVTGAFYVILAVSIGCSNPSTTGPNGEDSDTVRPAGLAQVQQAESESSAGADSAVVGNSELKVTVHIVDGADFEEVIQKHLGKVVLVDFWATWCPPCVEQFPHTVKLAQEYHDQGLAVVSVSLDEPEDKESVLEFLRQRRATFDNLISSQGTSSASFETFQIEAPPHYRLYDRTGKLVHEFFTDPQAERQFTKEDIKNKVAELLAET